MLIEKNKIKNLLASLSKEGLTRPPAEWEIANTYPLSNLQEWPQFSSGDYQKALNEIPLKKAQVYVHVPFCSSRCNYCFYNTDASGSAVSQKEYFDSINSELELRLSDIPITTNEKVIAESIYFGGGTPTKLDNSLLRGLISNIKSQLNYRDDGTFTVESSPETLSQEKLNLLLEKGVNRISIGIQSLDNNVLKLLNRAHDSKRAADAIKKLQSAELGIFNVDLIYGLPNQTEKSWMEDLTLLTALNVPEFTLYHLRINPSIGLANYKTNLEEQTYFRALATEFLKEEGYIQSRPHHFVIKDKLNFWKSYKAAPTSDQRDDSQRKDGGFVLALGPSAISQYGNYLFENIHPLKNYKKSTQEGIIPGYRQFALSKEERITRYIINHLVQGNGLEIDDYLKKFNEDLLLSRPNLEKILRQGLCNQNQGKLELTSEGRLVFDIIERAVYPQRGEQK